MSTRILETSNMETTSGSTQFRMYCHGCETFVSFRKRPRFCKLCHATSSLLEDVTNKNIQRPEEPTYTPPPNIVEPREPLIIQNNVIISRAKLEQKAIKVNHSLESFTCTSKSVTENECSICLDTFIKADLIPLEKEPDQAVKWPKCGHTFHPKCIEPWLMNNPSCPMCRTEL